jgi:hypothetical protein
MSDNQPLSQERSSLRESVRAELEEARKQFFALLDSLSEADFRQKSISSAWTIKELLVHIVFWLRETPRVVRIVQTGRGIRNIPEPLFDWLNLWLTRLMAWRQTRQSIAAHYERAYRAILKLVEGIQVDEWGKGASFGGPFHGEYRTIEMIIRSHHTHVQEHAMEIWRSLSREPMIYNN